EGKAGLYRDPELGIALAWREAKRPNAAWAERYRPGFATAIGFLEASQQASVAEDQAREAARRHELEQAQRLAEAPRLRLQEQQRRPRPIAPSSARLARCGPAANPAGATRRSPTWRASPLRPPLNATCSNCEPRPSPPWVPRMFASSPALNLPAALTLSRSAR